MLLCNNAAFLLHRWIVTSILSNVVHSNLFVAIPFCRRRSAPSQHQDNHDDNDIEAPKALDVQLRLPERGKFCFGGHFKRWQKEFSPVLSPYRLVKSKCQLCEVPNGFLACKVVSRH